MFCVLKQPKSNEKSKSFDNKKKLELLKILIQKVTNNKIENLHKPKITINKK